MGVLGMKVANPVTTRSGRAALAAAVAAVAAAAAPQVAPASHDDPAVPNDPLYETDQWGPQQVKAEQGWHRSTGTGALVAIVDSGIDLDHPDLAANTIPGNTFLDCGQTGCGNGDWQSGPSDQRAGDPHGTHVAGIAGADAGNGEGIAGVAPDAGVMAVRVLDDGGSGSFEDIGYGIRYAADNGAHVINLSLGAPPIVGQAIELTGLAKEARNAILYAQSKGVTIVAAAGNEAFPVCDTPSFTPGVVCVAATTRDELQATYSNDTVKEDLLAVAAPGGELSTYVFCGEGVLSTVPPGEGYAGCGWPDDETYDEYAGTSMAAPHVAGVAGLLVAQGCTRDQILYLFEQTSRQPPLDERGQWTPLYGYGIVDADAASEAAAELCDPSLAPAPPSSDSPPTDGDQKPGGPQDSGAAPEPSAPGGGEGSGDDRPCANVLDGTAAADRLLGSAVSDLLRGRRGEDRLKGGPGDDCLRGGGGADKLRGGGGDDELNGGRGADRVAGNGGDDVIRARRGGRDRIDCGPGRDTAFVNPDKDEWRRCEKVRER